MAPAIALVRIAGTVDLPGGPNMESRSADLSWLLHFVGSRNRPGVRRDCERPSVRDGHDISALSKAIHQAHIVGARGQEIRDGTRAANRRDVIRLVRRDGLGRSIDSQSGCTSVELNRPVGDLDDHVLIGESVGVVGGGKHFGDVGPASRGFAIGLDRSESSHVVDQRFVASNQVLHEKLEARVVAH